MKLLVLLRSRFSELLFAVVALFSFYSLAIWIVDSQRIVDTSLVYVPVAPLTALLFLLMSLVMLISGFTCGDTRSRCYYVLAMAIVVQIVSIAVLLRSYNPQVFSLEGFIFPFEAMINDRLLGRMSPVTAILFISSSIAIFLAFTRLRDNRFLRQAASFVALGGMLTSLFISLSYITEVPLFYGYLKIPVALNTAIMFVLVNTAILARLPNNVWPHSLLNFQKDTISSSAHLFKYGMLSALGFLIVSIGSTAILYLRSESQSFKANVREHLQSISKLKEEQIQWWIKDKISDTAVLESNLFLYESVDDVLSHKASRNGIDRLSAYMVAYIANHDFCSMALLDTSGNSLLAVPKHLNFENLAINPDYNIAISKPGTFMTDIEFDHETRGMAGHTKHIRIFVPIMERNSYNPVIKGVWLLQIDPQIYLYPFIQSWPTPSKSGETLLIRQEGDEVVFLNELRFKKDSALKFRLPVNTDMRLPAVQAVMGREGTFEGIDYRGKPVLAHLSNIEQNSWYLITKVDLEEIYAPLRAKGILTGSILVILILFSTFIVGMLYKRKEDAEQLKVGQQWKTTFDSVQDVIWLLDADFNIIRANNATLDVLGETPEQVVGKKCWSIVHKTTEAHESCPHRQMLALKARSSVELKNGDRWLFVSLDPILDAEQKVLGIVHIIRDITAQKEAELEIDTLNANLERLVRERTAQLEASNKELEAFSYSVSHDLRAPLRAIDGWGQVLLEDYSASLDADANAILDRIRAETQRMGNLIDTLITLSKVTRAEMSSKNIGLSEIASEVSARLLELHPEWQGKITIQPNLKAEADERLIEIVLQNLLSNAIKFSARTAKPEIELGSAVSDGNESFFIRDNGVGFEMKYANKLFGTFQRLHKSTEFPGIGIGLAMVKRIIERHGGKIWAESEPGLYTIFYFTLKENL